MLTCMVIDDEPLALRLISGYVEKTEGLELMGGFTDPIVALRALDTRPPDLIFLDIQMPELTGLQFMKIASGKCEIVITTAYHEFAVEGFNHDAADYLLKPISFERFLMAISRVRRRLGSPTEPVLPDSSGNIFVKDGKRMRKVELKDILYLEGLGDYVTIHAEGGKILTSENLKDLEKKLPAPTFIRIHKSFLVAIDKISYIENNRVVIQSRHLPVSDTYKQEFWKQIRGY
ncbi:MAG: response regulator transcription factor [Lewinellaceae bacterium]|nr:response regulator transcription factor [Lewinellaceae bacterium]